MGMWMRHECVYLFNGGYFWKYNYYSFDLNLMHCIPLAYVSEFRHAAHQNIQ